MLIIDKQTKIDEIFRLYCPKGKLIRHGQNWWIVWRCKGHSLCQRCFKVRFDFALWSILDHVWCVVVTWTANSCLPLQPVWRSRARRRRYHRRKHVLKVWSHFPHPRQSWCEGINCMRLIQVAHWGDADADWLEFWQIFSWSQRKCSQVLRTTNGPKFYSSRHWGSFVNKRGMRIDIEDCG